MFLTSENISDPRYGVCQGRFSLVIFYNVYLDYGVIKENLSIYKNIKVIKYIIVVIYFKNLNLGYL